METNEAQATERKGVTEAERAAIISEHETQRQERERALAGVRRTLEIGHGKDVADNFLAPFGFGGSRANTPLDQIMVEAGDMTPRGNQRAMQPEPEYEEDIELSEKEARSFSLFRAIEDAADNKGEPVGLAREISQERARQLNRDPEGFFLPTEGSLLNALSPRQRDAFLIRREARRSMAIRATSENLATTGPLTGGNWQTAADHAGALVPEEHRDDQFIEFLRPMTVFNRLGSRVIEGITGGDLALPRQNGGAVAGFVAENVTAGKSSATFDQVTMKPKEATVYSTYTKKLLRQSSPSVEMAVRQDLNNAISQLIEEKGIDGDGLTEPLGVVTAVGTSTALYGGAAGNAWANVLNFEAAMDAAHALRGRLGILTSLEQKQTLKAEPQIAGAHPFIWESNNTINGIPAIGTSFLDDTENQKFIQANWDDHLVCMWSGIDIVIDSISQAALRLIDFHANFMIDMNLRIPASFVLDDDGAA